MANNLKKKTQEKQPDAEHGRLVRYVNEADEATRESRLLSEKARDYYDSKQWTADEVAKLKKQRQAATVINRCKPKMDALMGMEKSAQTTAKAFPRTPKHEKAAEAASESIRFVLQDNAFDQIRSSTWENILIEGTGACEIIAKSGGGEDKDIKIVMNHIPWDRLIYDPHCRTKDFSPRTCLYLGQYIWMDYDEAVDKYPDAKDVLESMQSGSTTYDDKPRWMDATRKRVKIVELYYRKKGEVWYACFTLGGFCEHPKISPYVNEEHETEWPYEFASPFVDREGGSYGAMLQLLDVQDEINKRRSKALHLMSVRQVRGEKGAVEDVNKARAELARPDGYIETTPGMEFEVLKTGDMAAAQFNLLAEAKAEIDNVGANAATQGKDKGIQSGVALRARQQAGQTEVGPLFDTLKHWQYRVFRKVWNRVKQYWKAEKWIRVTDDEHNLRWVGLNKPITKGQQLLQQAQDSGTPPEQLAQIEQHIAQDPMMQEVVDTHNDIATLDVDIIISEVPDVLTAQIEDFQVLGEMVKSGFPMPPIAVIEASPLSNKDKIIKMMKEGAPLPPKAQQAMQQMQDQLKTVGEQAQKLQQENQQLKANTQTEILKINAHNELATKQHELKVNSAGMDNTLNDKIAATDHKRAIDKANRDANFEVWNAKLKASTQIACAEIAAKASNDQTLIEAERDANLELIGTLGGDGSGTSTPNPGGEVATAAAPAKAKKVTPIDKFTQLHAQSMDAHAKQGQQMTDTLTAMHQTMQKLADLHTQTAEQSAKPKQVNISGEKRDASGKLIGATVQVH